MGAAYNVTMPSPLTCLCEEYQTNTFMFVYMFFTFFVILRFWSLFHQALFKQRHLHWCIWPLLLQVWTWLHREKLWKKWVVFACIYIPYRVYAVSFQCIYHWSEMHIIISPKQFVPGELTCIHSRYYIIFAIICLQLYEFCFIKLCTYYPQSICISWVFLIFINVFIILTHLKSYVDICRLLLFHSLCLNC